MPADVLHEGPEGGHEIQLNGITMERFNICKHMYNMIRGHSVDTLVFFNFCLETWLNLKPVHDRSVEFNMPQLVQVPYRWFRDMVIVGAQAELERLRGRWHCNDGTGTQIVAYLRGWRFHAASDYGPEPLILDTEQEYNCEIPDVLPIVDTADVEGPDVQGEPDVPDEPCSDTEA